MDNNQHSDSESNDIPEPLGAPSTSSEDTASVSQEPEVEEQPYKTEEGLAVVRGSDSVEEVEESPVVANSLLTFDPYGAEDELSEEAQEQSSRFSSLRQALFFSLLGSFLVLGILFVSTKWFHIPTIDSFLETSGTGFFDFVLSEEYGDVAFKEKERLNILVLGVDYNYNEQGIRYSSHGRTDTIIVMSLDKKARFLNLLSIPRDTRVEISPYIGFDKINTAYSYGEMPQAIETVQNFLGVNIDHYVLVRVQAAEDIIEAMGGVTVDVEKDMDYDDSWGNLHIHLKQGRQVLNGKDLVGYARFRMDEEGDRGRIRRQQQVIKALTNKLKSPSMLARLPAISDAVKENFDTDMEPLELLDLARVYASFDTKNVHGAAIEGDDIMIDEIAYIHPYWVQNERVVRQMLKDNDAFKRLGINLVIRNQARDINWGYSLADLLEESGYGIDSVVTDDKSDRQESELRVYGASQDQIEVLQQDFPELKIRRVKELSPEQIEIYEDITAELLLGEDYGEELDYEASSLYRRFSIEQHDTPASYSKPEVDEAEDLEGQVNVDQEYEDYDDINAELDLAEEVTEPEQKPDFPSEPAPWMSQKEERKQEDQELPAPSEEPVVEKAQEQKPLDPEPGNIEVEEEVSLPAANPLPEPGEVLNAPPD